MFNQIFYSPQVKQLVIITYKYSISEFPHELTNNLRHGIFAAGGANCPHKKKKDLDN